MIDSRSGGAMPRCSEYAVVGFGILTRVSKDVSFLVVLLKSVVLDG